MRDSEKVAKPDRASYKVLLDSFGAANRSVAESVAYLKSLGYSQGQARNAVYRYRSLEKGHDVPSSNPNR